MKITLYRSSLCPRCFLARKYLLDIVEDDVQIDDEFDFDMEATDDSQYDFTSVMGDDEEDIDDDDDETTTTTTGTTRTRTSKRG